ncbi:hypothetical protein KI387_016381, partial [Taxus chinensis]
WCDSVHSGIRIMNNNDRQVKFTGMLKSIHNRENDPNGGMAEQYDRCEASASATTIEDEIRHMLHMDLRTKSLTSQLGNSIQGLQWSFRLQVFHQFCSRYSYTSTTADDLYPLFDRYGKVVDIFIPRDRRTGDSRGFAFVRYKYADEAEKAIERLDGRNVDGRDIVVQFAKYGPNAEVIKKGRLTAEPPSSRRYRSRSPQRSSRRISDDNRSRDYRSRSRTRDRYERHGYHEREREHRRRSPSRSVSPRSRSRSRSKDTTNVDRRKRSRSGSMDRVDLSYPVGAVAGEVLVE